MTCLARPSVGLVVRTDPRRWRLAKINRNRQCGVSRIRQRRVTCATKTSRFSDTPVPKARVLAKAVAVVASVLCVFGACDTSGLNNLASAAGTIDSIGIDKTKTNEKKITQITPRDYVRRAQQETKQAQRELSIAAAKKAEAESEIKKASAEKKFALEQEGEYKKREREAARKIKNAKWITDTATATTAATGVFVVSVFGTLWRSGGGSILVAGAIRNTMEVKQATKTVYAVRWDDPSKNPREPDGVPKTLSIKIEKYNPLTLKQAIAEANNLPCGASEVGHLVHFDSATRFLRPLKTSTETHATPDGAWVLWSKRDVENNKNDTCNVQMLWDEESLDQDKVSDQTQPPYPYPAMLPYPFEEPLGKNGGFMSR